MSEESTLEYSTLAVLDEARQIINSDATSTILMRNRRIVLAKLGMDGHIRGANFIAQSLRDAGMEVIHLGRFNTPEEVARVALEEDADVVGISAHSNEYREYVPELCTLLRESGVADDTLVLLGGIIAKEDREMLSEAGVDHVFGQYTEVGELVEFIDARAG